MQRTGAAAGLGSGRGIDEELKSQVVAHGFEPEHSRTLDVALFLVGFEGCFLFVYRRTGYSRLSDRSLTSSSLQGFVLTVEGLTVRSGVELQASFRPYGPARKCFCKNLCCIEVHMQGCQALLHSNQLPRTLMLADFWSSGTTGTLVAAGRGNKSALRPNALNC